MALVIEYRCDYPDCHAVTTAIDTYDGPGLSSDDIDAGWCDDLWFYMKDKRKQKAFYGAHHKEGGVYCPDHSPWAHDCRYRIGTTVIPDLSPLAALVADVYGQYVQQMLRDGATTLRGFSDER